MDIQKEAIYTIVINKGVILTYTAKIISLDDTFITFIDKFNKTYTYNKNVVVSIVPNNLVKETDKNGE